MLEKGLAFKKVRKFMPKQFYEIDPSSDFNERIFINLSMFMTIESCKYRMSKLFFLFVNFG